MCCHDCRVSKELTYLCDLVSIGGAGTSSPRCGQLMGWEIDDVNGFWKGVDMSCPQMNSCVNVSGSDVVINSIWVLS